MIESVSKIAIQLLSNTLFNLSVVCAILLCVFNPSGILTPFLPSNYLKKYGIAFLILSVYSLFFLLFKIGQKILGLYRNKRARDFWRAEQEKNLAYRIKEAHYKIANEFYQCMRNDTNKICRTGELDHLISISGLRFCFDLKEDHYIIKQDIFKIIKKYHQEIFENRYWDKNYEQYCR